MRVAEADCETLKAVAEQRQVRRGKREGASALSVLGWGFSCWNGPQGDGGKEMTQYLIVFGVHAMDHIPEEDMPAVAKAAHAVCQEAINAGVYVLSGGLEDLPTSIVYTDGTVANGTRPDAIGGITVVDVASREEALKWAAKLAAVCRCAQEVLAIGVDPELDTMLSEAAGRR